MSHWRLHSTSEGGPRPSGLPSKTFLGTRAFLSGLGSPVAYVFWASTMCLTLVSALRELRELGWSPPRNSESGGGIGRKTDMHNCIV